MNILFTEPLILILSDLLFIMSEVNITWFVPVGAKSILFLFLCYFLSPRQPVISSFEKICKMTDEFPATVIFLNS